MPEPVSSPSASPQCIAPEAELVSTQPAVAPAPPARVENRVELARAEERRFAGNRGAVEQRLFEVFSRMPSPGVVELGAQGVVLHNGGDAKVHVTRDERGEFLVQMRVAGQVGLGFVAGAHAGAGVSRTFAVRTPEAAADLAEALGYQTAIGLSAPNSVERVGQYGQQNLQRIEVEGYFTAGLRTEFPVILGSLAAGGEARVAIDYQRNALVIEEGVTGDAVARGGIILATAGVEGEFRAFVRTEVILQKDLLKRVEAGQLAVAQAVSGVKVKSSLVLEGEMAGEVATVFNAGQGSKKHAEIEVDLNKLAEGSGMADAITGHVTTLTSTEPVLAVGVELPGVSLRVSAATYAVHEEPLFGHHEAAALQSEVDHRRSIAP